MTTGMIVVMATLPAAVVNCRGIAAATRFSDPTIAEGAPLVVGGAGCFLACDDGEPAAGKIGVE